MIGVLEGSRQKKETYRGTSSKTGEYSRGREKIGGGFGSVKLSQRKSLGQCQEGGDAVGTGAKREEISHRGSGGRTQKNDIVGFIRKHSESSAQRMFKRNSGRAVGDVRREKRRLNSPRRVRRTGGGSLSGEGLERQRIKRCRQSHLGSPDQRPLEEQDALNWGVRTGALLQLEGQMHAMVVMDFRMRRTRGLKAGVMSRIIKKMQKWHWECVTRELER